MSEFFDSLNFASGSGSQNSQALPGAIQQSQAFVFWKPESPSPGSQLGLPQRAQAGRQPPSPLAPLGADVLNVEIPQPGPNAILRKSPSKKSNAPAALSLSPKSRGQRRAIDNDGVDNTKLSGSGNGHTNQPVKKPSHRQRPTKRSRLSRNSLHDPSSLGGTSVDDSVSSTDSGRFIAYVNAHLLAGLDEPVSAPATAPRFLAQRGQRKTPGLNQDDGGDQYGRSRAETAPPAGEEARQGHTSGRDRKEEAVASRSTSWNRIHTDPSPKMDSSPARKSRSGSSETGQMARKERADGNQKATGSPAKRCDDRRKDTARSSISPQKRQLMNEARSLARVSSASSLSMGGSTSSARTDPQSVEQTRKTSKTSTFSRHASSPLKKMVTSASPKKVSRPPPPAARTLGAARRVGHTSSAPFRPPSLGSSGSASAQRTTSRGSSVSTSIGPTCSSSTRASSKSPGKTPASAIIIDDEEDDGKQNQKASESRVEDTGDDSFEFEDDADFATIAAMMAEQGF